MQFQLVLTNLLQSVAKCFQFTRDLGGKVLCLDSLCAKNPIETFFLSFNLLTVLFNPQIKDERLK